MTEEVQTIVIDNGSGMIKSGFAGDEAPRSVFPSIVGVPKYLCAVGGMNKDRYIGDEACARAFSSILKYPIEHGVVQNWDDMEKILNYNFYNELKIDPSEHPVLISEASLNPKANREKMIQLMFETFSIPSFCFAKQGILSLFSSGRVTGVSCVVGDGVSEVVPIYKGHALENAVKRLNIGGRDITYYLQRILTERGYYITSSEEKEMTRDLKEKCGYVAIDYDSELQIAKVSSECDISYSTWRMNCITIADERFRCAELLFKPYLNGLEIDGIDQTIFNSINECSEEYHSDLYSNIVLSGGTTMFDGFPERIEKEITNLASPDEKIKVVAPPERKYAVWIGGSIFASLPIFPQYIITHNEYNDSGPEILNCKCF